MIFHKPRTFGFKFWLLFLIGLCLFICDQKRIFIPRVRPYLQMAIVPVQYTLLLPQRTFFAIRDYFIFQHELIHDRKNLQGQQLVLRAKLQELDTLKLQNEELQSLLKTEPVEQHRKYLFARVIGIHSEGETREVLIDSGTKAGVRSGEAVVAADGIIGQVIQTSPVNSRVMLLSDPRSAIPVTNDRTHENSIAVGASNNQSLGILNVVGNADIKAGDNFFSSGIGGHYPSGYKVGTVSSIDYNGKNIERVHIKPNANLDRLHNVLVVSIDKKDTAE